MAQFSGHYLLDLMSEENQQKFKLNFYNSREEFEFEIEKLDDFLDDAYGSFSEFSMCAFVWGYSNEGHDYWSRVNSEIENKLK